MNCSADNATTLEVQQRAVDTATRLGLTISDVTVTNCLPGTSTQSLFVEIDFDYNLITPLGGLMSRFGGGLPSSISLHSEADMRIE